MVMKKGYWMVMKIVFYGDEHSGFIWFYGDENSGWIVV